MDSNLLKEAIADAKAVRQTALANAKAALEEVFGRRFEAMFAPKLEEDSVDFAPESPVATAATAAPAMEEEASVNEADIDEIIRELEAEVGAEEVPGTAPVAPAVPPVTAPPMAPDAMGAVPPMAPPAAPMAPDAMGAVPPMAPPAAPMAPAVPGEEEMDEEIDINELLESLREESELEEETLDESVPPKPSGIGLGDNKTSPEFESSKIGKGSGNVDDGVPGRKVTSKEPSTASRPNQSPTATKTNLSTPGGALKEETVKSGKVGFPDGHKTSGDDDPTTGVDRPNQGEHATKDNLSTVPSPLKEENNALRNQLSEAEETVTYLRKELNEINLLNAKLLYTNKLFKEYTMPNEKKMKVVEMFDLAKNVREVKMTYAVIAESLNFGAEPKKISSKVQTITEGMASKAVAGTRPGKQIIAESAKSDMVAHFQKLAGIKRPLTNKQ